MSTLREAAEEALRWMEHAGKLFNTSASQVHRIVTNKIWKNIPKGDD